MTAITFRTKQHDPDSTPRVWRCDDCHCFHLLARETLLTFTPEEFAAFTQEVAECYCVQPQPNDNLTSGSAITL
jgi:hypothetical protein